MDPSGHECKHPYSGAGGAVYFVPCSICGYEPPSNEELYRILLEVTKKISMSDLLGINAERFKKKFVVKIYNKALKYEAKYNIPAAIMAGQACLESTYGKDVIKDKYSGKNSFNIFGIKAKKGQKYVLQILMNMLKEKR